MGEIRDSKYVYFEESDARFYNMNHTKRGYAYIFHNTTFDEHLGMKPRDEKKDEDLLRKLKMFLSHLKFRVVVFKNLKYKKISKEIAKGN
jgi:hypothetical protein